MEKEKNSIYLCPADDYLSFLIGLFHLKRNLSYMSIRYNYFNYTVLAHYMFLLLR